MIHHYKIDGMTCGSCAAKVKSAFLTMPDVLSATVDKPTDTATIGMNKNIPLADLQNHLKQKDSKYTVTPIGDHSMEIKENNGLTQYKPIFIVFGYITMITLLIQWISGDFDMLEWMRHFMAGFFITFSFFKMLDLSGFADSYMGYDIIAKRWKAWAYVYAFIELGLGISFILNCCPLATNITAFVIMTISIIGVLQSVLKKQKIQCACLGAVFNLPMSTVTIIEDALMILMSGYMIFQILG